MRALCRHLAWLVLSLAVGACGKRDGSSSSSVAGAPPTPDIAPASSAPSGGPASEPAQPQAILHETSAKPACRALVVTGLAMVDGSPLSTSALLDGAHWVELAAGSSVALRHTQTSREFRLIGPGHVLPCREGSEQILLADGQLSTSANLGVRPGAEVLIATPAGVVHYGDAALDLELGSKGLRVRVKQGEAWVEPEERGKPRFKNPLHSGTEARLPRTQLNPKTLVGACESAATAAESSARRVLEGGGAGAGNDSLGARAAAHMRERSKARTACAIAAAAAFTETDPATRQRLSAAVAQADVLWQRVPQAQR
ncbi:MAG TPA: hypothetical protein VER11_27360 [Polyangiaceae bacterium]|nr:hypothetical protein [Polyangiaceae bacterium]